MSRYSTSVVMLVLTLVGMPVSRVFAQNAGFEPGARFLIPGGASGPIALEAATHRVYLPQGTHVSVLDARTGEVVGDITDTPGVTRVALDDLSHRAFILSNNASTLTVVATNVPGFTTRRTIDLRHPANLMFVDPSSQRGIAVSGDEVTAVEHERWNVIEKPLGSDLGIPTVVTPGINGYAYVAFHGGVVGVLNTESLTVANTDKHSLGKDCKNPTTLLLDGSGDHLLVGCGEGRLKAFSVTTWKELGSLKVCRSAPNGTAFYKGEDLIVSSCADRLTFVQEQSSPPFLTVLQELKTERGIDSLVLDAGQANDPTIILAVMQPPHDARDAASVGSTPSVAIRKVSRAAVSATSTSH